MNPAMKNPKHAAVLAECGIQYDTPFAPIDVATRRAERIAKEKLKSVCVVAPAITPELQSQHQSQQIHVVQSQPQQQISQIAISTTQSQAHQLSQIVGSGTAAALKTTTASISSTGTSIVTTTVKSARPVTTLTMQDGRPTQTAVNFANLQAGQRIVAASLVSQNPGVVAGQKGIVGVTMATPSGSKSFTPAQMAFYRQQQLQQQGRAQQLKILQQQQQAAAAAAAVASGQKPISVTVAGTPQQRATLMKQAAATGAVAQTVGKQAVARKVSESEMAAFMKQQPGLKQQSKVGQVQVAGQSGLTPAQRFAHAGLQPAGTSTGGTPVATLVKTASGRPTTPQQIRQFTLHPQILAQRKLPVQKVAQLAQIATKGGVQTQLIVQQKSIPTAMTTQQLQQAIKNSGMTQFTHVRIFLKYKIE